MKAQKCIHGLMAMLLIAAMLSFAQPAMAAETGRMVVRFSNPTQTVIKTVTDGNYDVAAYRPGVFLDIVVSVPQYQELVSQGFEPQITQTEERLKSNLHKKGRDTLPGYRNYEQMLSELQAIAAAHPDICKLYDIGNTWGKKYLEKGNANYADYNHEIWAMKVSDNVKIEEDEPSVYYMGEHHAREPISMEMTMTILYQIVENYGKDQDITKRVNDTQIWFVPLVNPNGHRVVTTQADVWWRKNIRDNNRNGQFDVVDAQYGNGPDGVDLNRNYGFGWGDVGTSDDPSDVVYHGNEPWSEPEIKAIKHLLDTHHFLAGITYHTYSELVMYPYGADYNVTGPDRDALEELAVEMAVTIPATTQPHGHYDPGPAWGLYPTTGDLCDYAYGQHGIFSYTIEMADEFIPAADRVEGICNDNLEAAMILLNRPWRATLTGHVIDAKTGEPVEAEVFIHTIDDQMDGADDQLTEGTPEFRFPYRSNKEYGRYYRMLKEGLYDVSFHAPGYESVTRQNILITASGQTALEIRMEKAGCPVNNVSCEDIAAGIAGGSLFIPLSGENVDNWTVTYQGKSDNMPGTKTAYQLTGLTEADDQLIITASGYDTDGNPCEDTKTCTIQVKSPQACPVNWVNGYGMEEAVIGGSVNISLMGANVSTWEITYNDKTVALPGEQDAYELTGLVGGATEVTVTAKGFDEAGSSCEDTAVLSLNFAAPVYDDPALSWEGPYAPGDTVTVQIETENAVSVTLSDGVTIENVSMTPSDAPINPDFNNTWTFYKNTWSYDYTVFVPATLTAVVTNPEGDTVRYTWDIETRSETRTVSGKVTDANTGWPLYSEVVYGLGSVWTHPLTGEYRVEMPNLDYTFTVSAWADGYADAVVNVPAGEIVADFALESDASCAPGYTNDALFYESFDSCGLPAGWIVKDNAGTGAGWDFANDQGRANMTGGTGCFAISDSDYAGEVDIDTEMITPAIDCSALNGVILDFKYSFFTFTGSDIAEADVSTDGGNTWTNVWQGIGLDQYDFNPQYARIDISEQAAGQADVRIRFHHYNAFYEIYLQIDDVRVYDSETLPCKAPESGGLVIGNVTDSSGAKFLDYAVAETGGNTASVAATPNDPNVNDGFWYLYAPAGSQSITVSADGYIADTVTVNVPDFGVVRQNFALTPEPLGEMLDAPGLTWSTSGNLEWFGQREFTSDGMNAAQSGGITDSQYSELSTAVEGPGKVHFFWKVSSEQDWDFLNFYIGENLIAQISGETEWAEYSAEVPGGTQRLRWVYEKDSNTLGGLDSAWLDQVSFDPSAPVTPTAVTSGGITEIQWDAVSASGVLGYNVYRDGIKINDAPVSETSYTDKNAELWEMHCYSVSAVYRSGETEQTSSTCLMPHGAVIFVDANADGNNTGDSWADAFTELQSALAVAIPGDEIWIAAGTYTPDYDPAIGEHTGDRNASFRLMSGVAVLGGFSGTETSRNERNCMVNLTILSGDIGSGKISDNSFHVVDASSTDSTAVLSGFTITGGIADGDAHTTRKGAAIYNENGSPSLNNLTISGNKAKYQGGAMYNYNASPVMTGIVFDSNESNQGGAMYNENSSPELTNALFVNNAGNTGGAICNASGSDPVLINTTFSGNSAEYGAAVYNTENSNPVVVNSIFWGNTAKKDRGQIYDAPVSWEVSIASTSAVSYSIVQGGWDGEGNLDQDPLFDDPDMGSFRLTDDSPAADAGTDAALPADIWDFDRDGDMSEALPVDLDGNPRFVGTVDMGGFEKAKTLIIKEFHSADYDPPDHQISIAELLRAIELFNNGSYGCGEPGIMDGYSVSGGQDSCMPHDSDYAPQDWKIDLDEILRLIEFYTNGGYHSDPSQPDGFAPGIL